MWWSGGVGVTGWRGANAGLAGSSGLLRCGRHWVWAPDQVWGDGSWERAWESAWGRFPLGGGNDGERGRGYDGMAAAGVAEWGHGCDGVEGHAGVGCCSRRDTRDKRGYDGIGGAGVAVAGRGYDGGGDASMTVVGACASRRGRVRGCGRRGLRGVGRPFRGVRGGRRRRRGACCARRFRRACRR